MGRFNELRAFGSAAMARTVKNRRRSKIVVDTVYKILVGRCAHRTERAWLLQQIMDGAEFDDLEVAAVAATDESVDRMTAQMRSAAQARLRKDFERDSEGSTGLATKRVVFMHMMKTGGTSLSETVLHLDPSRAIPDPPLYRRSAAHAARLVGSARLCRGPYSLRGARPYTRPLQHRHDTARTREPGDPHFLTLRGSGPPYPDLTLDEFTSSDVYQVPSSNYQARQLAHRIGVTKPGSPIPRMPDYRQRATDYPVQSLFDSTPIGASEDELLDRARRNLTGMISWA